MQQKMQEKEIEQFQAVAKNPAQSLCFTQSVLVQKGKDQPKVQRSLYMSGVCLYICHRALITRKIYYRSIRKIVIALLSGQCLIMLNQEKQSALDLLIDSFEYRSTIVDILMKFNKSINTVYREETTLAKYITIMEKGRLVSTPLVEPTGLSTFQKLMESYRSQVTKSSCKKFLKDLTFLQLIYEGTAAKIYFGQKRSTKEHVAIKVEAKQMIVGQFEQVESIKLERQLMERIDSPFICNFKQSFMTPSHLVWVFEYVNGYTFERLITKMKTFPEAHIQLYIGETAVALGHLHEAGVSYNNLTLNHVMLDLKGHVKLINLRHSADLQTFSNNSPPIMYLSPQRALNHTVCGASATADWWALGVMMYQFMFAGRYPFSGGSRQRLLESIEKDGIVTEGTNHSEKCIDLLKSLLEKNPDERIGSKNGYHEVLAHPFFDNCRQHIVDRTHSSYFSSRGHAKHEHKQVMAIKLDQDSAGFSGLDQQLEGFEFSIDT